MRRLKAAIAVSALTAVCVLVGAVPASASIVVPPAPVAMTSGAMEAIGGTAVEGGAVVGTTATGAGALVVGAAWAGTTVGNHAAQVLQEVAPGWFYTSGSFSCDVKLLFDVDNPCDAQPPSEYQANADVTVSTVPAGWLPAGAVPVVQVGGAANFYGFVSSVAGNGLHSADGHSWAWTAQVDSAPSNGQTGALQMHVDYSGDGTQPCNSWYIVYLQSSGSTSLSTKLVGSACPAAGTSGTMQLSASVPANYAWYVAVSASRGAEWIPVGGPGRPAEVVADPTRWFTTEWTCADGSTGSAVSRTFHETDVEWPGMPAATCPGSAPVEFEVIESGEGVPDRTVAEWSAPEEYRQWVTGASQQPGDLRLYRLDEQSGARLDCFSSSSVCADWWTATTGATTNTDEYQCTYAGTAVELSECTVYAHAFDLGVYSDPATGEAQGAADGDPAPQDDNCPPPFSWAGLFNPWYYYQGGLCAMEAAFVPTSATTTAWTQFRGEVSDHPPVSIAIAGADFTNDVIAGVHGAGDCSTLPLQMADPTVQGPAATFDLCAGVTTAANTTWGNAVELIVTIAIIGTGAWIMAHRIGKSFGSKA